MKLRSWNYITFDQITATVTSTGGARSLKGYRKLSRRNLRSVGAAVVMGAAMLAITSSSTCIQPLVGTSPVTSIPIAFVDSTRKIDPPFLDHFSQLFDKSFAEEHVDQIREIDRIGSSLDLNSDGVSVAAALRGADHASGWKETA